MEHEVFVPVPVDRLREALADPARVARAVPGLHQDAGAEPVAGRLKVRVGSHSVTYRGAARVTVQPDGAYAVEGDAVETRGTGTVKLSFTVRLRDTDGGTTVTFDGTATADGRVKELPQDAVTSAVTRLLSRFAENLGTATEPAADETPEPPDQPEASKTPESPKPPEAPNAPVPPEASEPPEAPKPPEAPVPPKPPEAPEPPVPPKAPEPPEAPEPPTPPTPPTPPEPPEPPTPPHDHTTPPNPPAEAAHARRTMIGRSAEEVDHAPPRGRYAPVPAPQAVGSRQALRWAAPAAALVVASVIVAGRALRKRH